MANPLHPALGRLKNLRVVFHGKFSSGERENLTSMTQAHGGAVAATLDAKVTHLVLPDLASGTALQKKAAALRKKGAMIEVMDAVSFRELVAPTQDELITILKDVSVGRRRSRAWHPDGMRATIMEPLPKVRASSEPSWTAWTFPDST